MHVAVPPCLCEHCTAFMSIQISLPGHCMDANEHCNGCCWLCWCWCMCWWCCLLACLLACWFWLIWCMCCWCCLLSWCCWWCCPCWRRSQTTNDTSYMLILVVLRVLPASSCSIGIRSRSFCLAASRPSRSRDVEPRNMPVCRSTLCHWEVVAAIFLDWMSHWAQCINDVSYVSWTLRTYAIFFCVERPTVRNVSLKFRIFLDGVPLGSGIRNSSFWIECPTVRNRAHGELLSVVLALPELLWLSRIARSLGIDWAPIAWQTSLYGKKKWHTHCKAQDRIFSKFVWTWGGPPFPCEVVRMKAVYAYKHCGGRSFQRITLGRAVVFK